MSSFFAEYGTGIGISLLAITIFVLTRMYLPQLIARIEAWTGIKVSEQDMQQLFSLIHQFVDGAEEWAARELKEKGVQPKGGDKVKYVWEAVKQFKPDVTEGQVGHLIDSALARRHGMGASGEIVGSGFIPSAPPPAPEPAPMSDADNVKMPKAVDAEVVEEGSESSEGSEPASEPDAPVGGDSA